MDLFDWFKKTPSNVTVLDDVIWLTKQAKLNGITRHLSQSLAERVGPDAIVLIAHFPDCLDELQRIAESAGDSGSVAVTTAETLESNAAPWLSFDEFQTINFLVGERHPLSSHDESVLEFAQSLPCRCRLVYHVSLEDPLMRVFCGEWVESVLKKLGMVEDEAIASNVVARQIKKAQKEIASKSFNDSPADSAEMWMERNCPEIWRKGQK